MLWSKMLSTLVGLMRSVWMMKPMDPLVQTQATPQPPRDYFLMMMMMTGCILHEIIPKVANQYDNAQNSRALSTVKGYTGYGAEQGNRVLYSTFL